MLAFFPSMRGTEVLKHPASSPSSLLVAYECQSKPSSHKKKDEEAGLVHQLHPLVQAPQPIESQHLQPYKLHAAEQTTIDVKRKPNPSA